MLGEKVGLIVFTSANSATKFGLYGMPAIKKILA